MNNKDKLKDLIQTQGSLAQQLHQIRISKQLSMEKVCAETRIPEYVLDGMEIGTRSLRLVELYLLAKYYGKKVQISLVDI